MHSLWERCFLVLCLSFLICKIYLLLRGVLFVHQINAGKEFVDMFGTFMDIIIAFYCLNKLTLTAQLIQRGKKIT